MLKLLTDPDFIAQLDRPITTRLLEGFQDCLSPAGAKLLTADLLHRRWCEAWAAQFADESGLGRRLVKALTAIETLALDENRATLGAALNHLPAGYDVNRNLPPVHQAMHLWLIAQNTPGVSWPMLPETNSEVGVITPPEDCESQNSSAAVSAATPGASPAEVCRMCSREDERRMGKNAGETPAALAAETAAPQPDTAQSEHSRAQNAGETPAALAAETAALQQVAAETAAPQPDTAQSEQSRAQNAGGTPAALAAETAALQHVAGETPAPQPKETDAAAFQRLAHLPISRYDRVRRAEAKALGLRLATLDVEVARCRAQLDDDVDADSVRFPEIEPWPEPVNGAELFLEVANHFTGRMALPGGASTVFALWIPHAHAVDAFHQTPRLNLYSAMHGCGKSTAIDLLATLVPRPFSAASVRSPVVYRLVHKRKPTVLLDELDAYLPASEDLRGLLDAGHKPGARAFRCEGDEVRGFNAYAAAVLAGIGALPATLHDRSILIPLKRAKPGEIAIRFDSRHTEIEQVLCRKLARWAKDNFDALAACDPVLPPSAHNRLADNWRPLFAVAQVAGGPWPELVADAFAKLTAQAHPDQDLGRALLSDIRLVFTQTGADRLFSSALVDRLRLLPDRPWSGSNNGGKPMTEARLARQLGVFGVFSRKIVIGEHRAKGYTVQDFARAFSGLDGPSQPSKNTNGEGG